MIGNKQTYTVEAKNKKIAIEKITPELEKRGLILIKSSLKRYNQKALGIDGLTYVYKYDVLDVKFYKKEQKHNKKYDPITEEYYFQYALDEFEELKNEYGYKIARMVFYNAYG